MRKYRKTVAAGIAAAAAVMCCMSAANIKSSADSLRIVSDYKIDEGLPYFRLDRDGKNVVVLVLDRAIGLYAPYIFNEKPELKEQFAGFTCYTNTISFGRCTNFALPALTGGYEYTPAEINARSDELLPDKHNEAHKVLPVLFNSNGYEVTVSDPLLANYQWIPDISIFDDYTDMNVFNSEGRFNSSTDPKIAINNRKHNFFFHSLMKTSPLLFQNIIYDNGNYLSEPDPILKGQLNFLNSYNVLRKLPDITEITENDENTFLIMFNNITHEPVFLQEPEYEPTLIPDNTVYDAEHADRFTLDDISLNVSTDFAMKHYHINTSAYIVIGKWLDFMRENGVYDNTRIIIVSDHGYNLGLLNKVLPDVNESMPAEIEAFMPLLMVKDFGSTEFEYSDEFMTNADVPVLALDGLINEPVNPFTEKPINNNAKYDNDQRIILSFRWDLQDNANVFPYSYWASLNSDSDIKDINSWHLSETEE